MSDGIALTIETLAKSRNSAATQTLLAALDSSEIETFDNILLGLARRRSKAGHLALLEVWHTLDEAQRDVIKDARGCMSGALRDALLEGDQLFDNAAEVAELFAEYDLVPTLITIAEDPSSEHVSKAIQLASRLIEDLSRKLHSPRDETDRRNPEAMRDFLLESLERSVGRFRQHKQPELIEAYVTLSGVQNRTLRSILDSPHHPCFQTVVNTLSHSFSPGVVHLLFEFLKADFAHPVIRNVVSKRSDPAFLAALSSFVTSTYNKRVRQNLHRIRNFSWLEPLATLSERFSPEQVVQLAAIVARSGIAEPTALTFVETMFQCGNAEARLIACQMLAEISTPRADELVLVAIDDDAPEIAACAIGLLRDRQIPALLSRLMPKVEHPSELVQRAAKAMLSEYNFESFLVRYDQLDQNARRSTGALIRRVDDNAIAKLRAEIEAPTSRQRLRGIEMAGSLSAYAEVADCLTELLADDDYLVRTAAVGALQYCTGSDVQNALMTALEDLSPSVQAAAETSLSYQGYAISAASKSVKKGVSR